MQLHPVPFLLGVIFGVCALNYNSSMGDNLRGRQLCNMECWLKWRQTREYFWPARWQREALINLRMCCLENPSSCVAHMVSLKSATTGIYGPLDLLKKMPLNLRPFQAVLLLPYPPDLLGNHSFSSAGLPCSPFQWSLAVDKAFHTSSDSILVSRLGQQHLAGSNSRWLDFKVHPSFFFFLLPVFPPELDFRGVYLRSQWPWLLSLFPAEIFHNKQSRRFWTLDLPFIS